MSEILTKPKTEKAGWSVHAKLALVSLMTIMALTPGASALTMDFNGIQVVLSNITTVILPAFLDLVVGALPIIITLAIIGFVVSFLDKILSMIKF